MPQNCVERFDLHFGDEGSSGARIMPIQCHWTPLWSLLPSYGNPTRRYNSQRSSYARSDRRQKRGGIVDEEAERHPIHKSMQCDVIATRKSQVS